MKAPIQILGLIIALASVGCGPSKTVKSTSASSGSGTYTGGTGSSQSLLAECNGISSNTIGIGGALSSYYDSSTRQFRDDLARIVLTSVPAGLTSSDTQYLQMHVWSFNDASNTKTFTRQNIGMVFIHRQTGSFLNSNSPVTSLSKATINGIINAHSLANSGVTTANFFQHVIMVISGLSNYDDGISIASYDSSQGTNALGAVDALLPPFAANPTTYAASHPSSFMRSLHPNASMATGLSESQYQAATNTYCAQF